MSVTSYSIKLGEGNTFKKHVLMFLIPFCHILIRQTNEISIMKSLTKLQQT